MTLQRDENQPAAGRRRRSRRVGVRGRVVVAALLTAAVTSGAAIGGFPGLPDWMRVVLAVATALLAGAATMVQSWRQPEPNNPDQAPQGGTGRGEAPQLARPELFQLPPTATNFTDREQALAAITTTVTRARAAQGGASLCVISGQGGIGKTALAVHAAHEVKALFADGQLYANLHGMGRRPLDAHEVLGEFLRELGVEPSLIPSALEERARVYRARLSGGRFLVLLDNAADEAQVRPLVPWDAGCAVLVTCRGPLAGLDAAERVPLRLLEQDASLLLLARMIGQSRVDAEVDAARKVVALCGYLPLAVKVAGARLATRPHWRIARLLARLADERTRLGELRSGDMEVRAVIVDGYSSRPEHERLVFRRLGLAYATSFPVWAVAALADEELRAAEDLLESLTEAQLVEVAGEDSAGQLHYGLHDLLRDLARERLAEEETPADRDAALGRYVQAYLAVAAAARRRLEPGLATEPHDQQEEVGRWGLGGIGAADVLGDDPVAWFTFERANLDAVVRQAFDAGQVQAGWSLVEQLGPFYEHQAQWASWREAGEAALRAAGHAGDARWEAQSLVELGWAAHYEGHSPLAIERLRSSVARYEGAGDQTGQARALSALGVVLHDSGNWREAVASFEHSLELFAGRDRRWEARTQQELAIVYRLQGHWQRSVELFEAALVVFEELGDRRWAAATRRGLADVYYEQGRFEDALALLEPVLAEFVALGDRRWAATTRMRIGEVLSRQGRLTEARTALDEARPALREVGDQRWEAMAIMRTGEVDLQEDHLDAALTAFQQALPVFERLHTRRFVAITLTDIATVRLRQHRPNEAIALLGQALAVFEDLQDGLRTAETRRARGRAHQAAGQPERADADFRAAQDGFAALGRHTDVRNLQQELADRDQP